MKLIKTEKKVPELIWGNKYRLLEAVKDIVKGTVVVILDTEVDFEGEVLVYTKNYNYYVEPHQLQAINQETLEPLETETGDKTFTVELTEDELRVMQMCVGRTTVSERRAYAKVMAYQEIKGDAGYIGESVFQEISDILV